MDKNDSLYIAECISDTVELSKRQTTQNLLSAATSLKQTNVLVNDVEFWKWMGQNHPNSFTRVQLQGKGYEWDWMTQQRANIKNLFSRFDAGTNPVQAGIDVTKTNLFNDSVQTFQHKAYTSSTPPDLSNTPLDTTVVTNKEHINSVTEKGYKAESFKDSKSITKATDKRMEQAKSGRATGQYNFKNVSVTMAKAGLIGCVIGMGMETISCYKDWKNGNISGEEYLKNVCVSGANAGVTAAATSGLMIPVTSLLTIAGVSSLFTIPVAIAVGSALDKIIAPCFGRGEYKKILDNAKYYVNLESVYKDFIDTVEQSANSFQDFVSQIKQQDETYKQLKQIDSHLNEGLKDLYNKI